MRGMKEKERRAEESRVGVEKNLEDKDKRRKKNRKGVEILRGIGEEERRKKADSNRGEKVFCLWRIWAYGL